MQDVAGQFFIGDLYSEVGDGHYAGEAMLLEAAKVVAQRRQSYGDSGPLMAAVAQRWSIVLGEPVSPAQVVLCLIDLKLARLGHDPAHADSILDVAGYAAVLQEVAR